MFSTSSLKDRHFYKFFSEKKFWLGDINDLREMFEAKIPSWLKPFEKYLSEEKLKSIEAPICQCIRIKQELHKALNTLCSAGLVERRKIKEKELYFYRLSAKYWQVLSNKIEKEKRKRINEILKLESISLIDLIGLEGFDSLLNQRKLERLIFAEFLCSMKFFGISIEDLSMLDEEDREALLSLAEDIFISFNCLLDLKLKIWLKKIKRAKDASSLKEPLSFGVFAYFID